MSGPGSVIGTLLAVGAGNLAGRFIANKVTNLSPTIMAAVQGVGGFFLSRMSSPMIKGVGIGIAANGISMAAQSFGLLNGIGMGQTPVRFLNPNIQRNASPLVMGTDLHEGINYDGMGDIDAPDIDLISGIYDEYS